MSETRQDSVKMCSIPIQEQSKNWTLGYNICIRWYPLAFIVCKQEKVQVTKH